MGGFQTRGHGPPYPERPMATGITRRETGKQVGKGEEHILQAQSVRSGTPMAVSLWIPFSIQASKSVLRKLHGCGLFGGTVFGVTLGPKGTNTCGCWSVRSRVIPVM